MPKIVKAQQSQSPSGKAKNSLSPFSIQGPLTGVVLCLTGLVPERKMRLHKLVQELGGSFTREFDALKNTHLIAVQAKGDKYELATSCPGVHIVQPEWLEDCEKRQVRLPEAKYALQQKSHGPCSWLEIVDQQLCMERTSQSWLFGQCHFLLIGFESNEEKSKISRLIRRGMGTIYWNVHPKITHIVVHDECDIELRKAVRKLSTHLPALPDAVSPRWVVVSWTSSRLQQPQDFPPSVAQKVVERTNNNKKTKKGNKQGLSKSLFRGSFFVFLRLTAAPDSIDFDASELEKLAISLGGDVLNKKWINALKADSKKSIARRTCFVVVWGSGYSPTHLKINQFLSEIQRYNLCDIVPVTPIWLQAHDGTSTVLMPSTLPCLFLPQSDAMHTLPNLGIMVSVSGFTGHERNALICVLRAMGAEYTETLCQKNTHVICHDSTKASRKMDKALEWGLHVVSIRWLHHVLKYGYKGKQGLKDGCESLFTMQQTMDSVETTAKLS